MIKELTSVRVIFMLAIFLFHRGISSGLGVVAVAYFFVLGGFCAAVGYSNRVNSSSFHYGSYLRNRLIKYYPVHWLFMAISLIWGGYQRYRLFLNATLMQSWIPKISFYFSYNGVSWYLSDCVFFVLITPYILRFYYLKGIRQLLCALFAVCLAYLILPWVVPKGLWHAILYINPLIRAFDFIIGIIGGLIYLKVRGRMRLSGTLTGVLFTVSLLIFVLFSFFFPRDLQFISVFYWPFALILFISLALGTGQIKFLSHPVWLKLGECSFSFYLAHKLCIHIVGDYLELNLNLQPHWLVTVILLFVTVVIAYFTRMYFEKPIISWLK